ncbi:MAG: hypothetical protein ACI86H_002888, partial [bacterium]
LYFPCLKHSKKFVLIIAILQKTFAKKSIVLYSATVRVTSIKNKSTPIHNM